MADQLLSAHAEWSTWWDHSWYSGAPGFQLQSRDWTTSSSQPRSLTLPQATTPASSATAAQTCCLYAHVWLDPGCLLADSPVLPHSASGRFQSCRPTQCSHHGRLHTTHAHRVISWVRLPQRPYESRGPSTDTWECQWRLTSTTQGHRLSSVSATPAATAVPFQSFVHSLTAHHLRFRGSRNRHFWAFHSTYL